MATGRTRDVELIVVEVSPEHDPGGTRLRAALDARAESERRRLRGLFLLYSTIVFSVPLGLALAWPGLVAVGLVHLSLFFASVCAAGALLVRS
jgi:hypothetical protein